MNREIFDDPGEKQPPSGGSGHPRIIGAALEALAIMGAGTYSPVLAGFRLKKPKSQMHNCPGCNKPTNGTDQQMGEQRVVSEYCFRCVTAAMAASNAK